MNQRLKRGVYKMVNKQMLIVITSLVLAGCQPAPAPFDVSKVDCTATETIAEIENPEHRAKAQAHCAKLKARESKFEASDKKDWSLN
jgi:entry exclusion lipoprotein TrbK